jgi:hypothetical protein
MALRAKPWSEKIAGDSARENIFFLFVFHFYFSFFPIALPPDDHLLSCFVRSAAGMRHFFVPGLTPRATNMSPLQG